MWFNINTLLQKYTLFIFTLCTTLHIFFQMVYNTLETCIILLESMRIIHKIIYLVEHILKVHKQLTCCHQNLPSETGLQSLVPWQTAGHWCLSYLEGYIHAFRQERSANHFSWTKGSCIISKAQRFNRVQVSESLSGKCT